MLITATLGWTHKSKASGDSRHRIILNQAPQNRFLSPGPVHMLCPICGSVPLGGYFMGQALQLASGPERCPFVFSNHLFSLCMFSSCPGIGNFPILSSWINERKDELVSTQEAHRCHGPAVKRPEFVMLPAVRLMFSPSGSPQSRDHVTHYSPHHPGQSRLPSEVSGWNISNFFPPAQTSLLRDSLNSGSLGGPWLLFGSFICLRVMHDRRRAWCPTCT